MKQKIMKCDKCGIETRHLIGKKESVQNGAKREFKHCCECNQRTIKSKSKGTYIKDYSNDKQNKINS